MPKPTVKTQIQNQNTILSLTGEFGCVMVTISSADVTANSDGRKYIKAGTFLGTATSGTGIMEAGAKAKPANGATTEGLAFNDIDVTHGDDQVAMLFSGTVGLDRIPAAPTDEAKAALSRVKFTKD